MSMEALRKFCFLLKTDPFDPNCNPDNCFSLRTSAYFAVVMGNFSMASRATFFNPMTMNWNKNNLKGRLKIICFNRRTS